MNGKEKNIILAVDDAPPDLAVLNEILKDQYRFLAATDRAAAMSILHSRQLPDLILLDVSMPKDDGLGLCREIKADESTRQIPVIFVTAKSEAEDEAAGFAAGGVDYITKPLDPHLVRARVKTHLELKLAREHLERQNEILRENERLREEVEHISRHDLKNPLMLIMNIPEVLMRQENITPKQRDLLKMIEESGRRMLEMINRSIDLYKMENGTYDLRAVPVEALTVIRHIATGHEKIAGEKNVQIDLILNGERSRESDSFRIEAEELLFYSIMSNLIRNAIDASPADGRVTLSIRSDKAAIIEIHNSGAIPEKIRGRFFEKFATANKHGGTGLGAYSARLIARTLGGNIEHETSEAAGTTITVTLPLAK